MFTKNLGVCAHARPVLLNANLVISTQEEEFLALENAIVFVDEQQIQGKIEVIDLEKEESPCVITKADLCEALVDVCGILLTKRGESEKKPDNAKYVGIRG